MLYKTLLACTFGLAIALSTGPASAQEGVAANGEKLFRKCKVCHSLEAGKNKLGPSLAGVIGRTAGTLDGYKYSKAMTAYGQSGVVWQNETLIAYLEKPRGVVKGTKMAFVGLKKLQDRLDVVAYLQQAASSGQ